MKKPSFEDKLTRLLAINQELERGEADLDRSIALFKEGMTLSGELTKQLEAAELEIKTLLPDADEDTL